MRLPFNAGPNMRFKRVIFVYHSFHCLLMVQSVNRWTQSIRTPLNSLYAPLVHQLLVSEALSKSLVTLNGDYKNRKRVVHTRLVFENLLTSNC